MSQPGPIPESQSPEASSVPAQPGVSECQELPAAGTIILLPPASEAAPPESEPAVDAAAADSATAPEADEEACRAAGEDRDGPPPGLDQDEEADAAGPEEAASEQEPGPAEQPAPADDPAEEPAPGASDEQPATPLESERLEAAPESEPAEADADADAESRPQPEPPARPGVPPAPSFPSEAPKRPRAGMMALLKLDKVDEDDTFRLRGDGEVDSLATSIAKLGQLFPVELRLKPPDRFQVVCGFRRVAALRLLKRERVVARVYTDLNEEDALQLSLAELLESRAVNHDELVALRERLRGENRLVGSVADTLERAISPPDETLSPELVDGPEEEVDLDELAQDLLSRLAAVNQDLALVVELWSSLEPGLRDSLLEQLGYPEQLGSYLRGLR